MIEHSVGVTVAREYELKRLDLDYFVTEDGEGDISVEPTAPTRTEAAGTAVSSRADEPEVSSPSEDAAL